MCVKLRFGTDHAAKMHELPDEHLGEILATLKKIAVAQGVENYNILQVGLIRCSEIRFDGGEGIGVIG